MGLTGPAEMKHVEMLLDRIIGLEATMQAVLERMGWELMWRNPKKKAETPVKESRPVCDHKSCVYEVGGQWSCAYRM